MNAGELNYRLVLQSSKGKRDKLGGEVRDWKDEFVTWGAAEPLTGRELFAAQERHSLLNIRFRVRYNRNIIPAWRVLWEGKGYDILEVIDFLGRHWEMHLMCLTGGREPE